MKRIALNNGITLTTIYALLSIETFSAENIHENCLTITLLVIAHQDLDTFKTVFNYAPLRCYRFTFVLALY